MKLMITAIATLIFSCSAFAAGTWNGIFTGDLKSQNGHCEAELKFKQQGNVIRLEQPHCNYQETGNPTVVVGIISRGDFLVDGYSLLTESYSGMIICGEISLYRFKCDRGFMGQLIDITHDGNGNFFLSGNFNGIAISGPLSKKPLPTAR